MMSDRRGSGVRYSGFWCQVGEVMVSDRRGSGVR